MVAYLDQDGIKPALDFRVLEGVIADPEHQTFPLLPRAFRRDGFSSQPDVRISLASLPHQGLSVPGTELLPVDVPIAGLLKALPWNPPSFLVGTNTADFLSRAVVFRMD
jgi:hypothetical protein